jgi:hypothetical protein
VALRLKQYAIINPEGSAEGRATGTACRGHLGGDDATTIRIDHGCVYVGKLTNLCNVTCCNIRKIFKHMHIKINMLS